MYFEPHQVLLHPTFLHRNDSWPALPQGLIQYGIALIITGSGSGGATMRRPTSGMGGGPSKCDHVLLAESSR